MSRKKIDWAAIERDWRTDKFTLHELERKHGVGYASISRKATREGWKRDLGAMIKQQTAILLQEEAQGSAKETQKVIATAAELNKRVILGHREDIATLRRLVKSMVAKIEAMGLLGDADLLAFYKLAKGAQYEAAEIKALLKNVTNACNTPAQVAALKNLSDTLAKLVALERQAFALDEADKPEAPKPEDMAPVDATLAALNGE